MQLVIMKNLLELTQCKVVVYDKLFLFNIFDIATVLKRKGVFSIFFQNRLSNLFRNLP